MPLPDDALAAAHRVTDDDTIGELLLAVVDQARLADVDPETALRAAAVRYRDTVRAAELAADAACPTPISPALRPRSRSGGVRVAGR